MLIIKKELSFYDFQNEYENILSDIDYEAQQIIFDSLSDMFYEGTDDMTIRDYIRFQMNISTAKELLNDYNIIDDDELKTLDDDEINERIENYLDENTFTLGSYLDDDNEMIFIYDEF